MLQWVPSHVGLLGNEQADLLAKKGSKSKQRTAKEISLQRRQQELNQKMHHKRGEQNKKDLQNKKYEDIAKYTEKIKHLPKRTAVAVFRLETGHESIDDRLHRMGIVPRTNRCSLCGKSVPLSKEHMLHCRRLDPEKKDRMDLAGLYWEARGLMV